MLFDLDCVFCSPFTRTYVVFVVAVNSVMYSIQKKKKATTNESDKPQAEKVGISV